MANERVRVQVSLSKGQHAKFLRAQKKLDRATLGPVIADAAILGRPILESRMLNGGEESK